MPSNRVVIYARISEDREREGDGVNRQVEQCVALAKREGLRVVETFEENDTSAYASKPRPLWRRVVALAREGQIDGIVAYASDRLYRRMLDLEEIIDLVEDRELTIYTVSAGRIDLNSVDGRQMARILASVARGESERMAMRIASKHKASAKQGRWKGGRRPWGYMPDGVTVYELEANAIRKVAQEVLLGMNMKAAACLFNALTEESEFRERDPKTKKRPTMSNKVLRDVLISQRIVGRRIYVPQAERARYARSRTTTDEVVPPPWRDAEAVKEDAWPAILDEETWRSLRDRLLRPGDTDVKSKRPEISMLSGLLKCGECYKDVDADGRHPLVSLGSGAKSYTCGQCGRVGINKPTAEKLISNKVGEALERLNGRLPESSKLLDPDSQARRLSHREQLDEAQLAITRLLIAGKLTEEGAAVSLDEIARERATITAEEDRAHRMVQNARAATKVLPQWGRASPAEKRAVIAQVAEYFIVDRVARSGQTFQPGRVRAKWWDRDVLVGLGPAPIPAEETERRTEERRRLKKERDERYRASAKGRAAAAKRKKQAMAPGA